ncbi:MAG: phosphatase PAP2 family protein [Actinobacteria bacterium]|nr:phosphatase PAP2 family protein [Actinomycetota bacterium]
MSLRSSSPAEDPPGARLRSFLRRDSELSRRRLFVFVAAGAALGVAVESALGFFITSQQAVLGADRSILRRLALNRTPELTTVMRWLTILGGSAFVAVTLALAAALVYRRTRQSRWPAFVAGTVMGNLGLDNLVKLVVDRPRPDFRALTDVTGSSFPSGHASTAAALFVALAFLGNRWERRFSKIWIWASALSLSVLVATSRVYLGAHWPTDVVAGLALGGYWTAIMATATAAWPRSEGGEEPG